MFDDILGVATHKRINKENVWSKPKTNPQSRHTECYGD